VVNVIIDTYERQLHIFWEFSLKFIWCRTLLNERHRWYKCSQGDRRFHFFQNNILNIWFSKALYFHCLPLYTPFEGSSTTLFSISNWGRHKKFHFLQFQWWIRMEQVLNNSKSPEFYLLGGRRQLGKSLSFTVLRERHCHIGKGYSRFNSFPTDWGRLWISVSLLPCHFSVS